MNQKMTQEEIMDTLRLYHCAGGHTKAAQARAALEEVGFRFETGHILWPDGAVLTYSQSGDIEQREVR